MSIFVKLITSTPDAAKVVASAAKLCYSQTGASDIMEGLDSDKIKNFLDKLRRSGHMSPFEHASYTFAIDGISRVASHQLVRHRMASYSQQSQRYVGAGETECVIPPSIENDPYAKKMFIEQINVARNCYIALTRVRGIPQEDARFILPHGMETKIVVTMNARELLHFFELRLCNRAQWEIREMARQMLCLVREDAPELFYAAGPPCIAKGKCTEENPCGCPVSL